MCLQVKYSGKIKKLPKEFTAYKVVKKGPGGHFYPPMQQQHIAIKSRNSSPTMDIWGRTTSTRKRYRPYYHSFLTKAALKSVDDVCPGAFCFIKIKIKRKDVTCIGGQGKDHKPPYYKVIVSKAFTTEFEQIAI